MKMTELAKDIQVITAMVQEESKDSEKRNRRKRRWWVRDWIKQIAQYDESDKLLHELKLAGPQTYINHIKLSHDKFSELQLLESKILVLSKH